MKNLLLAGTAIIAGLAFSSQALAESWKDQYKTVRFGILSGENEKDRIARYTPFEEYLKNELGVEVEIFTAGSYDGVIQAIAADQIEFAFFGSSSYAAAYTETGGAVDPLISRVQDDGSTGYFSVVAVRCDSGYKSLDDLEGKGLPSPIRTAHPAMPSPIATCPKRATTRRPTSRRPRSRVPTRPA